MTDSNADYYENDDCYEDDGSELIEDEDIVDLEDDDEPCEDLDQRMKRLGYDIVALHLEHGIRDEESVRDMRLVEELCKQLQIPLEIKRVSVPNMMKKGESVESAARRLRYAFFEEATKNLQT